jgi:predicted amidohydrolase
VAADGGLENAVVHVDPQGRRLVYAKTHMDVKERQVFTRGDAFVVADEGLGLACCYDLAFPEPGRILALQGARALLVPMAWEVERAFVMEKVAAARAVENVAYVVCVNQCGTVGPYRFSGASRALDPLGEALVTLGDEEAVEVVELDLGLVDRLRDTTDARTYPLLDDRRPDLYASQ